MRLAACLVAVLATLAATASTAHAEEPTAVAEQKAFRIDTGLGSAVGTLGGVVILPQHPRFALELGAGLGFSGLQLSAMGRLRLGDGKVRFTPGVGVSAGVPVLGSAFTSDENHDPDDPQSAPRTAMFWGDVDLVGLEVRSASGWIFAASAGLNVALSEGHYDIGDLGNTLHPGDLGAQARVGVGWTF